MNLFIKLIFLWLGTGVFTSNVQAGFFCGEQRDSCILYTVDTNDTPSFYWQSPSEVIYKALDCSYEQILELLGWEKLEEAIQVNPLDLLVHQDPDSAGPYITCNDPSLSGFDELDILLESPDYRYIYLHHKATKSYYKIDLQTCNNLAKQWGVNDHRLRFTLFDESRLGTITTIDCTQDSAPILPPAPNGMENNPWTILLSDEIDLSCTDLDDCFLTAIIRYRWPNGNHSYLPITEITTENGSFNITGLVDAPQNTQEAEIWQQFLARFGVSEPLYLEIRDITELTWAPAISFNLSGTNNETKWYLPPIGPDGLTPDKTELVSVDLQDVHAEPVVFADLRTGQALEMSFNQPSADPKHQTQKRYLLVEDCPSSSWLQQLGFTAIHPTTQNSWLNQRENLNKTKKWQNVTRLPCLEPPSDTCTVSIQDGNQLQEALNGLGLPSACLKASTKQLILDIESSIDLNQVIHIDGLILQVQMPQLRHIHIQGNNQTITQHCEFCYAVANTCDSRRTVASFVVSDLTRLSINDLKITHHLSPQSLFPQSGLSINRSQVSLHNVNIGNEQENFTKGICTQQSKVGLFSSHIYAQQESLDARSSYVQIDGTYNLEKGLIPELGRGDYRFPAWNQAATRSANPSVLVSKAANSRALHINIASSLYLGAAHIQSPNNGITLGSRTTFIARGSKISGIDNCQYFAAIRLRARDVRGGLMRYTDLSNIFVALLYPLEGKQSFENTHQPPPNTVSLINSRIETLQMGRISNLSLGGRVGSLNIIDLDQHWLADDICQPQQP